MPAKALSIAPQLSEELPPLPIPGYWPTAVRWRLNLANHCFIGCVRPVGGISSTMAPPKSGTQPIRVCSILTGLLKSLRSG